MMSFIAARGNCIFGQKHSRITVEHSIVMPEHYFVMREHCFVMAKCSFSAKMCFRRVCQWSERGQRWTATGVVKCGARLADTWEEMCDLNFQMAPKKPAMSNTERQRQFRKRNPGYYQRLHAKRNASIKATVAVLMLKLQQEMAPARQLLLPAPVERLSPTLFDEIDAAREREREAVMVLRAA